MTASETRKLAAILAADVVGYSRLAEVDEDRTLARLRALRSDFLDPTVAVHHGRIVKRTGDGTLIEFRSVVDAVRCAIEVQAGMVERNAGVAKDRRIEFRVGIHLGDVVEETDGDLMGDGINIAARLEGICETGGICISEDAYRQVRDKVREQFVDLGEKVLKNIGRPMRAYQIASGPDAARTTTSSDAVPVRLALPDKPSIAVLPFQNLSGGQEQEYFADGVVEEIITGLSRIKWLFVISRNSSFIFKGKPIDVKKVGRELGVRYVLEGSVRRSGDHVRLTGQLIETETATHVWADRYDGTLGDIFALQDAMTMSVIGAVEPTLRRVEVERARRKRPDNLDAYDLFLRALPFAGTAMPEHADKALELLQEAIRLEPDYAAAHGFIAWCHEQRYLRGGLHAETREAARRHAHAAIAAGSDDAMALAMGGFVIAVMERDYATALDALDRALALSPSSAIAFGFSSIVRGWMGDRTTAIEHAEIGIRLSPYDPLIFLPYVGLAYAHFFAGNPTEAAHAARKASHANPQFSVPRYLLAASLVQLGRIGEAKANAVRVLELQPGFTVSGLVSGNITTPEDMNALANALRQAGLPE
jgi:TolB-like protein/class 3 adenylate cyclase/tetratricopeptide (TPR) repeat protein